MKKSLSVLLLLVVSLPAYAVDGKSLLIGISIGLGVYTYQGTRNHVVLPTVRAIQRTIRPLPSDKEMKRQKKIEKLRKELLRQEFETR